MDTLSKRIVYGSTAVPLKKPEGDHTHKWSIYVRPFHPEDDLSHYVKRVAFKLHESFIEPTRYIDEGPFEVNETGWGEFQIQIQIMFRDPQQKSVSLVHQLRLYNVEDSALALTAPVQPRTTRPVIFEHFEDLVFSPPTEMMRPLLLKKVIDLSTSPRYPDCTVSPLLILVVVAEAEKEELTKLECAKQAVLERITQLEPSINNK